MTDNLIFHFDVLGNDFTSAGQASVQVKKNLRQLGLDSEIIRRVSIAMYEGKRVRKSNISLLFIKKHISMFPI